MRSAPSALKWLAFSLLVIGSAVADYYAATGLRRPAAEPLPPLALSASSRTLGDLREGEVTKRRLTIENGGGEDIHISRLHGDCRCATFTPRTLTVPAGDSADVEVEIRQGPASAERFELTILAEAETQKGNSMRAEWRLGGRIVRDAELSATHVDFGEVTEDRLGKISRAVMVKTTRPVEWVTATSPTPALKAEAAGTEITLTAMGPFPQPPGRTAVRVEVKFKDSERPLELSLPAGMRVLPEIEVIPERILAGRRRVGTISSEEVLLASRTGKRLTVTAFGVEGDGVKIEQLEADKGQGTRLRLEYTVTRERAEERAAWVDVKQAGEGDVRRVRVFVQSIGY